MCYEVFLRKPAEHYPDIILIRDNAPVHIKLELDVPGYVFPPALPPYSPELNPVGRWFLEFRRKLADLRFDSISHLQTELFNVLRHFWDKPQALVQLTNFPWWKKALAKLDFI